MTTVSIPVPGAVLEGAWFLAPRSVAKAGLRPLTFVLLHEGLGSVSTWGDFPAALAARVEAPVFAFSRRGYGGSSRYPSPWPSSYMHEEADQLDVLLSTAVPEGDLVLLGHSDGASIATLYAGAESPTKNGARVRGVVLIAPHFFVEAVAVQAIAMAAERFMQGELRSKLERHHGANVDDAFWGWNRVWRSPEFRPWDIRDRLARIRVPTLVVQGTEDPYGTWAQVDSALTLVPQARACALEGVGHIPHREAPGPLLESLASFVDAL